MKLPWVRKYTVIAFHVTVTFTIIYLIKTAIDIGSVFILDLHGLISDTLRSILKFMSVFSVVIGAFVIAYILDPIADFFQKRWDCIFGKKSGERRTAGAAVIFIFFALLVVFCSFIGYMKFGNLGISPSNAINRSAERFSESYGKFRGYIEKSGLSEYLMPLIDFFADRLMSFADKIGKILFNTAVSVGMGIADIIASLVISFYFIRDKQLIIRSTKKAAAILLSEKIYRGAADFINEVNSIFSGYIRGQLTDAAIMAVLMSSTLSVIGVDFAVLIGIISGFSNIIPYFGALIGLIMAVSVALISGGIGKAIVTAAAMLILQQIDGMIIVPRIVGDRVSLSPVLVIIALAVFGKLFGIIGMIFAVPVFAVIKIYIVRMYIKKCAKKEAPVE